MSAGTPDKRTDLQAREGTANRRQPGAVQVSRSAAGQVEGKTSTHFVMLIVCIVTLMVFAPPTFIVIAVGMAPTFVRAITHSDPDASRLSIMALLNLAGVAFFLMDLWTSGNGLNDAVRIVTDVNAVVVMYGAAAISFLLFWVAPSIAAGVLNGMAANRFGKLGRVQEALIREWGQDIGEGISHPGKTGSDPGHRA